MYLIVARNYPPEVGGIQTVMGGLSKALSKYELIKVFTFKSKNNSEFDNKVSFSIERIGGSKLFRKYRLAYLVNEHLKNNKSVKAIIADHWKSLELIKSNKKKICLIHSKEINHPKGSWLNKKVLNVLNNVDYIVANSQYTKNLAIGLGVNSEKIIVINPGIDPIKNIEKKHFDEAEKLLKNKKPRLITVSRFDKRMNHEKITMALKNLKQIYPNILYTCIGNGEELENIKKLVNELQLKDQVLLLEEISQELKNALVAKSNLFVMPSVIHKKSVEGFGVVYVEAAQYGVPSIAGKDGGASDAIIDYKTGLFVDGNNLEEIYSAINELLDKNKFIEFCKAAKENSINFHWDKVIQKYLKILN